MPTKALAARVADAVMVSCKVRGVQKLLAAEGRPRVAVTDPLAELRAIRDALAGALAGDGESETGGGRPGRF